MQRYVENILQSISHHPYNPQNYYFVQIPQLIAISHTELQSFNFFCIFHKKQKVKFCIEQEVTTHNHKRSMHLEDGIGYHQIRLHVYR